MSKEKIGIGQPMHFDELAQKMKAFLQGSFNMTDEMARGIEVGISKATAGSGDPIVLLMRMPINGTMADDLRRYLA